MFSVQPTTLHYVMISMLYRITEIIKEVHPRTGHKGPEEEERYSSTLSLTSVLDGGGRSTPHPGCFNPGKDPVPIEEDWGGGRASLDGCGKSRPLRD